MFPSVRGVDRRLLYTEALLVFPDLWSMIVIKSNVVVCAVRMVEIWMVIKMPCRGCLLIIQLLYFGYPDTNGIAGNEKVEELARNGSGSTVIDPEPYIVDVA